MIWTKTPLGIAELKARSLSIDPAARNLLMLVDGTKTEEMFLAHTVGARIEHFRALFALNLIEPANPVTSRSQDFRPGFEAPPVARQGINKAFAMHLTRLISKQLGFAGLGLNDLVQRARSTEELHDIAEKVIALIRERQGDVVADDAAWRLFGRGADS